MMIICIVEKLLMTKLARPEISKSAISVLQASPLVRDERIYHSPIFSLISTSARR